MHCPEVVDLLDSFLDDQLLVETNHEILRHLADCRRCRSELDDRRRVRLALRGAFDRSLELAPSPDFLAAIADRTRSAGAARHAARGRRAALAVAAALLLIVGSLAGGRWISARRTVTLARAAVGDHRNCALQFRLSEQPISLEEAAQRFDPVYRRFVSVSPTDSRVKVVARHSCVFQGRRFAHLVLSYGDQLVSVLVLVDTSSQALALTSLDGERVLAFRAGRFTAFVVSALADGDLRAVATTMQLPLTRALAGA